MALILFSLTSTIILSLPASSSAQSGGPPATTTSNNNNNNWLTYQNSSLGIKIQYPPNWIEENIYPSSRIYFRIQNYTAPVPNGPVVYVNVFRNTTLKELISMMTPVTQNAPPSLDGQIVSTAGTYKGNQAQQLLYNWTDSNLKYTNMEDLISNGNDSFLIAYSALVDDYNKYLAIAQEIINSFEITNSPSQNIPEDRIAAGICQYLISSCI